MNTPTKNIEDAPLRDSFLSADEKIQQALRWVGKREPIAVPTVLTRWEVRRTREIPTLATNGRVLKFNPDFVDRLSLAGTKAIVLHEVGHVLSMHHHRRGNRDQTGYNIASDLALNCLLFRGYRAAFGSNYPALYEELIDPTSFTAGCFVGTAGTKFEKFPANKTAEEYYDLLKQELQQPRPQQGDQSPQEQGDQGNDGTSPSAKPSETQSGSEPGSDTQNGNDSSQTVGQSPQDGNDSSPEPQGQGQGQGTPSFADIFGDPTQTFGGGVEDCPVSEEEDGSGKSDAEREDERTLILETILNHEAVDTFSPLGLGSILSGVKERLLGDVEAAHKVNWRRVLDEFLTSAHAGQPTYERPNRRLHSLGTELGILFPSNHSRNKTNGAVIVDTSGSMGDTDCNEALGHIGTILTSFPESTVNLIQCDTEVRCSGEYTGADFPPTDWKGWLGRGGTNLSPALRFVREHKAEFQWVIVVTDGEFYRRGTIDPQVPTLWVVTRDKLWGDDPFPFGKVVAMHAPTFK
jgi:predicted metal-dependent peptidase